MKNLVTILTMAIVLLVAATAVAQAGESAECAKCKQDNADNKRMRLPPRSCSAVCDAPAVAKADPPKDDKGKKKPEKKVEKPPQENGNGGITMADLKKAVLWITLVLLLVLGVVVVRLRSRVAALEEALQVIKRAQDEFPNARFL